ETLMFTASADKRFAAISNEVRVRVEGSKKRLMTVRPRSAGTFLTSRREMSRNVSAVSSRCVISPADKSRMPRRSFLSKVVCIGMVLGLWSLVWWTLDAGLWTTPKAKDQRPKTTYKKAAIAGRFVNPSREVVAQRWRLLL